jgi:hypothetical protein
MELDISPIAEVLLDPGFDLKGWIRARALLRKPTSGGLPPSALPGSAPGSQLGDASQQLGRESLPSSQPAVPAAKPAALRGTQFVNLAGAVAAVQGVKVEPVGSAKAEPRVAAAASPKMLTIGLPMATAMNLTFLGAAAGPKATLEGGGGRWPLEAAVVSIGSDPKSDVSLTDPQVSHVHAQVTRHGSDMFLRDVGSRGGSFVNGQRLTLPHRLQHGDKLQFGQVELTYLAG